MGWIIVLVDDCVFRLHIGSVGVVMIQVPDVPYMFLSIETSLSASLVGSGRR